MKNYFTSLSASSNGSRCSTNESRNATELTTTEVIQNHVAIEHVVDNIARFEIGVNTAQPQPKEHEVEGIGFIGQFYPHVHIVSNPPLRIPIERFHPNIQSEVRR